MIHDLATYRHAKRKRDYAERRIAVLITYKTPLVCSGAIWGIPSAYVVTKKG